MLHIYLTYNVVVKAACILLKCRKEQRHSSTNSSFRHYMEVSVRRHNVSIIPPGKELQARFLLSSGWLWSWSRRFREKKNSCLYWEYNHNSVDVYAVA